MRKLSEIKIGTTLKTAAAAVPKKATVVDYGKGKRYTYGELNNRVNSIANSLLDMGVKKGDFIATLMKNGIELVELPYVAAKIGAILAPLPYRLRSSELKQLLNYCKANVIILEEQYLEEIESIKKETGLEKCISTGLKTSEDIIAYDDLLNNSVKEPKIETDEDAPFVLMFSSGTTGLPKGFLRTQYQLFIHSYNWLSIHDFTSSDVNLIVFPLYGGVALTNVFATVFARAKMIVMDFEPTKVLKAIDEEKVTFINCAPTMGQMLLEMPNLDNYKLDSLRAISFVGSALPASVLEGMQKKITPNVYEYYGTQDCGTITINTPDMKRKKPDSCGAPIPVIDLKIIDSAGNEVPIGNIGEVIVSGPSSSDSYYEEEEKTKASFKDGWFYTGDLGKLDEDGYLYLVGRTKDMIVTGAQNVSSVEVENTLLSHEKVSDCAVIGLPDERWGEMVTAVIIAKSGVHVDEAEIIEYCRENLAHFKAPKKVIFTDSLPRTTTGKIQKNILVEKYSS